MSLAWLPDERQMGSGMSERTPDTQALIDRANYYLQNAPPTLNYSSSVWDVIRDLRDALAAQKDAPVTAVPNPPPIWLRREGSRAIVAVGLSPDCWVDVIEEQYDNNFSHIVEPSGIEARVEALLNAKPESKSEMEKP